MNKSQLLALCIRLGISANADMTVDQLLDLVNTHQPVIHAEQAVVTPTANAVASLTKKQSVIKGFNYTKDYVRIVFANGDNALLDSKNGQAITTAIALKGQTVEYRIGEEKTSKLGTKYHEVFIDCIS
jgi:hypothetical protein